MPRRNKRTNRSIFRDTMALSGWLFADLLLGIAMLFLVFNTVGAKPKELVTPTPSPTTIPTYTRYPTYTPIPTFTPQPTFTTQPTYTPQPTFTQPPPMPPTPTAATIDKTAYTPARFKINNPNGFIFKTDNAERERVRTKLHEIFDPYYHKRRVVLVITSGYTLGGNAGLGTALSREVNNLLFQEFPDMFADAIRKDYLQIVVSPAAVGTIELEVYFFQGGP